MLSEEEYEKRQWVKAKAAREKIIPWSKKQNALIYRIEFSPLYIGEVSKQMMLKMYGKELFGTSLSVLVFYLTDAELKAHTESGKVEKTKQQFMRILGNLGWIEEFGDEVRFEFDSDENVKRHYEGNYGHRLRG